jgi:hypothetical protein
MYKSALGRICSDCAKAGSAACSGELPVPGRLERRVPGHPIISADPGFGLEKLTWSFLSPFWLASFQAS